VIDVHARDVVMQLINEKVPTLLHQIATIIPQFFV
jgi:hypothetical protein